jgi:hypothetical protein
LALPVKFVRNKDGELHKLKKAKKKKKKKKKKLLENNGFFFSYGNNNIGKKKKLKKKKKKKKKKKTQLYGKSLDSWTVRRILICLLDKYWLPLKQ